MRAMNEPSTVGSPATDDNSFRWDRRALKAFARRIAVRAPMHVICAVLAGSLALQLQVAAAEEMAEGFCNKTVSQIRDAQRQDEREALESFYESTGGESWWWKYGWLDPSVPDHCNWEGIICDESSGAVIKIVLGGNGLNGTISTQIGKLQSLEIIHLHENHLFGTIPSQLGSIPLLSIIGLSDNKLVGTIPHELAELQFLTGLDIAENKLTGTVPSDLGRLKKLVWFRLEENFITGTMPESICKLWPKWDEVADEGHLQLLLADCGDEPPEIDCWCCSGCNDALFEAQRRAHRQSEKEALVALYDATGGESWYENDGWLKPTVKDYCRWHGVTCDEPNGAVILIDLQSLGLSGTIPPQLEKLQSLEHLDLGNNYWLFGTIPPELGNLLSLNYLGLEGNSLNGTIPFELGDLMSLSGLHLNNNMLTGIIPSELGLLENLHWLSVQGNFLKGTMPELLCHRHDKTVSDTLAVLKADCGGSTPEVECPCCSECDENISLTQYQAVRKVLGETVVEGFRCIARLAHSQRLPLVGKKVQ